MDDMDERGMGETELPCERSSGIALDAATGARLVLLVDVDLHPCKAD